MSEVDDALEELDALTAASTKEAAKTIRKLQKRLHDERDKTWAITEAIDEALAENATAMRVKPVPKPRPRSKKQGRREEIAVPWLSDLQAGKRTPTYNSDVMERRVEKYTDKVLDLIDGHRAMAPVNVARPWWLGDMIEGEDIFPGQAYLIDSSNYEQVFTTAEALIQHVRTLLVELDRVDVEAVIGNHGRVGRKGQMAGPTNHDRFVYRIVQIALANEPRFSIKFAEPTMESGDRGWYWLSEIGSLRTLLVHGDQFRGSLGVPWYGIRKKVLGWKAMGSNPAMAFPDFDDVAFGHWHQPVTWRINGIGVRGNGTTESWNDFAAEMLAGMGRPSQRLMFVDPEKGRVTAEYDEVWLDEDEDAPMIPWQTLADAAPDADDEEASGE